METPIQKKEHKSQPQVQGKFQLSPDKLAELKDQNSGLDLLTVGVPGIGVVVLAPAASGDARRFRKRTMGKEAVKYSRDDCFEELARCSIVWPTVEELDAELEAKRKTLAWIEIGNHAAALAGLDVEKLEGN